MRYKSTAMKRILAVLGMAGCFQMFMPEPTAGRAIQIRDSKGKLLTVDLPDVAPDKAQQAVDRAHGVSGGGQTDSQPKPLAVGNLESARVDNVSASAGVYAIYYGYSPNGGTYLGGSFFNEDTGLLEYRDGEVAKGRGDPLMLFVSREFNYIAGSTIQLQYDGGQTVTVVFPRGDAGHLFYVSSDGKLYYDPDLTQKVQ